MSTTCNSLATKAELEALENKLQQLINGKLDSSRENAIVNKAANAGSAAAIGYFAGELTGINAQIGKLGSQLSGLGTGIKKNAGNIAKNVKGIAGNAAGLAGFAGQIAIILLQLTAIAALEVQILRLKNQVNAVKAQALENEIQISKNNAAIAKNNADIAANSASINRNNARIGNNSRDIANLQGDVANANSLARTAIGKADNAAKLANQAKAEAKAVEQRVNGNIAKAENRLESRIAEVEKGIDIQLQRVNIEIGILKQQINYANQLYRSLRNLISGMRSDIASAFQQLTNKTDKPETRRVKQATVTNAGKITDLNGRTIGLPALKSQVSSNTTKITKVYETQQQQSKIVVVGGSGISAQKATEIATEVATDITNTKVGELEKLNTEQYTDLKKDISNLANSTPQTLQRDITQIKVNTAGLAPGIASLQLATAPAALAAAAAAGVCQTTAPGGCMNNNILQPMNDTIRDTANAAGASAAIANNVILNQMQPVLNTVKKTTDFIKGTTSATYGIVSHAKHGLQASYNFAQKAWSTLPIDKAMQGITLVASVHNAAMLSQNAAYSLGDAASQALQLFGIKNPVTGEAIDVNQVLGRTVKNTIERLLGAEAFAAATETWLKVNRIHQAAGATCCAIVGTRNALLEADEITGGNVAKLANSLQSQGVLEDDSFRYMDETPDYKTPFGGILGFIDKVDDFGNRVSSIVNSGLEIQQSSAEFVENSNQLKQAIDNFDVAKKEEENSKDLESVSPDIDRLDLIKEEIPE